MTRYAAFLRAINVGGHVVKMDQLRRIVESTRVSTVSTFIASGNVLFESPRTAVALEAAMEKALRAALGYDVKTMIRSAAELEAIVRLTDERKIGHGEGATLYVGFLKTDPTRQAASAAAQLSNAVDTVCVEGRELYWRCRRSFSERRSPARGSRRCLVSPQRFGTSTRCGRWRSGRPQLGRKSPGLAGIVGLRLTHRA